MNPPMGGGTQAEPFNGRLALLLAMAMFVLVVDTSIMNVSVSAVVKDIGSTVSGLQSAIALLRAGRRHGCDRRGGGPLPGGFITTFLSWRVAFMLEAVIIAVVLSGIFCCR